MTIDAKWMGACKADQKPGDMIMAGRKLNVRDLQNLPAMPGPACQAGRAGAEEVAAAPPSGSTKRDPTARGVQDRWVS